MKNTILVSSCLLVITTCFSQRDNLHNENSIRPIMNKDIMWKKKYTRMIDLREKQNIPYMASGMELPKFLIAGILSGKLTPYQNDSLKRKINLVDFQSKLTIPSFEEPKDSFDIEEDWFPETTEIEEPIQPSDQYFFPSQLYIIEMNEDAVFDKQESRIKYDIQSLTLYIPADLADNVRGIQDHLVTLSYKECVNYFNELDIPVWFNSQNDQENKYFSDSFDLRLFSSHIVRVSNPENLFLEDIYGTAENGMVASEIEKNSLMEFESNLWEN